MKTVMLVVALCLATFVAQAEYELLVTDTGTNESGLYGINSSGWASGFHMTNSLAMPWVVSPELGYINLPPLPGLNQHSVAYSIDDQFEVAGSYGTSFSGFAYKLDDGVGCVWLWDGSNYVSHEFGTRPATIRCIRNGWIAGQQNDDNGFVTNIYTGVGSASKDQYSGYYGVDNNGNAVGFGTYGTYWDPVFITNNGSGDETFAPGQYAWQPYGSCTAMNTNDEAVGIVGTTAGFYWNPISGATQRLNGACYGINDSGAIVGQSNGHACMWVRTNGAYSLIDLNSFVSDTNLVLVTAFGINDSGRIVGQCLDKKQNTLHGFMLVPATPAPPRLDRTSDPSTLDLSWQSQAGHDYAIRASLDLVHWTTYPGVYAANGPGAYVYVPVYPGPLFLRVMDVTP